MPSSILLRWSGLAALVGGVLFIILDIAESILFGSQSAAEAAATGAWIIMQLGFFIAVVLIMLGPVGLYLRQAQKAGTQQLIAFVVAFAGTVMGAASIWGAAFFGAWTAKAAPEFLYADPSGAHAASIILAFGLFALGWLLFGLAALRGEVLPRGAAMLLMIGSVLFLVLGSLNLAFVKSVAFGAAVAWMGYALWSRGDEPASIPEVAM